MVCAGAVVVVCVDVVVVAGEVTTEAYAPMAQRPRRLEGLVVAGEDVFVVAGVDVVVVVCVVVRTLTSFFRTSNQKGAP